MSQTDHAVVGNTDISQQPEGKDDRYRRLEREWQNEIGHELLDGPHEDVGSGRVFKNQFHRLIEQIDLTQSGLVAEVGCGKGHFLAELQEAADRCGGAVKALGVDVSKAVDALPEKGLIGICADGEALPFADCTLKCLVYDGALHHLIDYESAVREAYRTLRPGGQMILFEPVSSVFSRTVHRILDPIVFESVEYESPIDQEYKDHFREDKVIATLQQLGMKYTYRRTDFLAYPLTGCYAGSIFSRWPKFMLVLLRIEKICERTPVLKQVASFFSWRFLLVATKPH